MDSLENPIGVYCSKSVPNPEPESKSSRLSGVVAGILLVCIAVLAVMGVVKAGMVMFA